MKHFLNISDNGNGYAKLYGIRGTQVEFWSPAALAWMPTTFLIADFLKVDFFLPITLAQAKVIVKRTVWRS